MPSARPGQRAVPSPVSRTGAGGELHQQVAEGVPALTSNQGVVVADNQNSLRGGQRGPTLLEDFLLREKITHFDHERIPERVVHARGSAAHGYFECTHDCSAFTRAAFLAKRGKKTPVFTRFSTVAGGAGSADTPRDVRGFAVKFYTDEGNFDLVGNNVPVFFIQDAIKFPDLIHAVKMEPDRGFPQAASAHDTFWDFISLTPESLHMVMWAMSDRTLPRSLRMIDGFGVHTFRLVNAAGEWQFVKFHWRSTLGVQSTTWDEAVQLAGADSDYHRRDLWQAIDRGDFPSWTLGLQVFDQATADSLPFDVLDPTKLIPEELVPIQTVGRMVLDRNPANFFAETEQVAFCPSHLVPGIDFSNDPLLQGRLFSYLDTQLSRLGGPNFHQRPINQPRCPFHNLQRDGQHQMQVPGGRVAYEPNSLAPEGPRESPRSGFNSLALAEEGPKARLRPESFADHYSQARLFYRSLTPPEQGHIAAALAFEQGKVDTAAVRERVLGHLAVIDAGLLADVCQRLGVAAADVVPARPAMPPQDLPPAPSLSQLASRQGELAGREVAVLVADGVDAAVLNRLRLGVQRAGAKLTVVAPLLAGVHAADGSPVAADHALAGAPSCLFDAVAVLGGEPGIAALCGKPAAADWVRAAWRHLKAIGHDDGGHALLQAAGVGSDGAVVALSGKASVEQFVAAAAAGKHLAREGAPGTDA
ncbi:catalase [Aquabacterium sp. OR-4]|uniref:catalase n=1 Tax=Aquabacterium sp. OR-4 TaxID=2978127 RepID=UPI0028C7A128|nr:catalase [Aquabacterium sp. OR-4]MDT7835096.1 catalase [Aquabacterium sp. OR-4]